MTTLLIDSNFICHQALHTLPKGLSHGELPTGIMFGFISRIIFFCKMFRTNRVIFCWDSRQSLRRDSYPQYKAHRTADRSPEEKETMKVAYEQFDFLYHKVLPTMGWKNVLMFEGYESDDIIAKITTQFPEQNFTIVSSDHDLYQLLTSHVRMFNPSKRKMYTDRQFYADYGITPHQWIKIKQIAGCPSDNVKGIPGVGEKTAVDFLLGKLKVGSKKHSAILAGHSVLRQNLPLVRLPYPGLPDIELVLPHPLDIERWEWVFNKLGFNSMMSGDRDWVNIINGRFEAFSDDMDITDLKGRRKHIAIGVKRTTILN